VAEEVPQMFPVRAPAHVAGAIDPAIEPSYMAPGIPNTHRSAAVPPPRTVRFAAAPQTGPPRAGPPRAAPPRTVPHYNPPVEADAATGIPVATANFDWQDDVGEDQSGPTEIQNLLIHLLTQSHEEECTVAGESVDCFAALLPRLLNGWDVIINSMYEGVQMEVGQMAEIQDGIRNQPEPGETQEAAFARHIMIDTLKIVVGCPGFTNTNCTAGSAIEFMAVLSTAARVNELVNAPQGAMNVPSYSGGRPFKPIRQPIPTVPRGYEAPADDDFSASHILSLQTIVDELLIDVGGDVEQALRLAEEAHYEEELLVLLREAVVDYHVPPPRPSSDLVPLYDHDRAESPPLPPSPSPPPSTRGARPCDFPEGSRLLNGVRVARSGE